MNYQNNRCSQVCRIRSTTSRLNLNMIYKKITTKTIFENKNPVLIEIIKRIESLDLLLQNRCLEFES
jgi:hypothetical protein